MSTPNGNDKGSTMTKEAAVSLGVEGYLEMNAQELMRNEKSCATETKSLNINDTVDGSREELPAGATPLRELVYEDEDIFSSMRLGETANAREDVQQEKDVRQGLGEKSTVSEEERKSSKLNLENMILGGMTEDISFA